VIKVDKGRFVLKTKINLVRMKTMNLMKIAISIRDIFILCLSSLMRILTLLGVDSLFLMMKQNVKPLKKG